MGALLLHRGLLFVGLCVALLAVSFSYSSATSPSTETSSAVVFGRTECLDCAEKSIKSQHAFKGLYVAIKCKVSNNGVYETIVAGKLNKKGAFKARLPEQALGHDGKLKHECVAQVHDVSGSPCPADEDSELVLERTGGGANTFAVAGKIPFASATCASAFFWPHHKFPAKPKLHPVYKPFHKLPPIFKKPLPPPTPVPVYKPPTPTHTVPVYKPPTPAPTPKTPIVKKPCPPLVPVYKPPTPVYKPPVPVYKPPTPVVKPIPPPVPVYKKPPFPPHPFFKKPLPPFPYHKHPDLPKFPPISHKPLPPIFKKPLPPFPYHKPHPSLPRLPPTSHKPLPPIFKKPFHKDHPFYKKPFPKYPPSP